MPCEFLTDSFKLVRKSFPPVFGPFFSPPSFPLAKLEAIILFTCGLNVDLLVHPFLFLPGLGVLGVVAGRALGSSETMLLSSMGDDYRSHSAFDYTLECLLSVFLCNVIVP